MSMQSQHMFTNLHICSCIVYYVQLHTNVTAFNYAAYADAYDKTDSSRRTHTFTSARPE